VVTPKEESMNRAEFEKRLREDPEFRERLDKLQERARYVQQIAEELTSARKGMFDAILELSWEDVPLSSLARIVELTPQRVNAIVREGDAAKLVPSKPRKRAGSSKRTSRVKKEVPQ
jgi:hypothetical protein